jgi:ubiquinone/menaquinone biosynthesis C-methylase UbiE
MEGSHPGKPQIWGGWTTTAVHDPPTPVNGRALPGIQDATEFADRLYALEALHPAPTPARNPEGAEPYTLQWFLSIENQRHTRQARWIPRLLEFAKHPGETLLGLGSGLGTDWLQYARHGAAVVVCNSSAEQLALSRRNFELRGMGGRFLHAKPTSLPLEGASIDVACVNSLLHEIEDPRAVVEEVYRVLKPGGKVLAVTPARYDVDFWFRACFPWQRWATASGPCTAYPSIRFTRRGLRRLFGRFVEHRIHKRQLRRSDVPHVWRWIPRSLLERLMGRVLVLKAFKPLSAAIPTHVAA